MELNFFRHVEVIEASSAKLLALKIGALKSLTFQMVQIWSDGTKHYAMINAHKKIPVRLLEMIEQIKE